MLKKYAELIVKKGLNVQKDQEVLVQVSVENVPLAREVAKCAYEAGAKEVIVQYNDDILTRLKYENCPLEHFDFVPDYVKELKNQYALRDACFLNIVSSDPEALKGIDPLKIQKASINTRKACEIAQERINKGMNRWCIVGAPSISWANKVFPEMSSDEAVEALWNAIFKVTRVDKENPLLEWELHHQSFERRVEILNSKKIKTLHYKNALGTDLTIGLTDEYVFEGGGCLNADGLYNFPNMPTEEIFSTPHREKVNGIVYSSLPLNYNGSLIDEFYIEFKDGRIVNYGAKEGYDVLKSIIEIDEGSHYLGEVAFVPYDSPIRNTEIIFFNTLFDENAACHLAIGRGFNECVKDGLSLSSDELLAKGVNQSLTHVDFMIGTQDLSIVATLEDGSEFVIFENGNYAF